MSLCPAWGYTESKEQCGYTVPPDSSAVGLRKLTAQIWDPVSAVLALCGLNPPGFSLPKLPRFAVSSPRTLFTHSSFCYSGLSAQALSPEGPPWLLQQSLSLPNPLLPSKPFIFSLITAMTSQCPFTIVIYYCSHRSYPEDKDLVSVFITTG